MPVHDNAMPMTNSVPAKIARSRSGRLLPRVLFLAAVLAPGLSRLEAQTPAIIPLAAPQLWQRAQFRVEHAPVATNCFDPDLIRLDATFTPPSGHSLTVPAFWYQDFSRVLTNGIEVLALEGAPQWRIRYTPAEPGDYTVSLNIQTNNVSAGKPVVTHFNVPAAEPSGQRGYVRVAPDHRYFETSDGRPLRLIGQNVCWAGGRGTFDYDVWFGGMKGAGENFARLWLAPWFMGLEHKPGTLNNYDLRGAWQLDTIFSQAEQDGIYLMLCFDHHGMYQVDNPGWSGSNNFWKTNPYNELNGGPCTKPNDFFTNVAARAIYQKRLRYLVGRYGYSPQLLAWQFFNEIDNVFGPLTGDDVVAWHREMGQWLRAHDPYGHLITTSLTGGSERPEIWSLPEMDFSMYHSYAEPAPGKGAALAAQSMVKRYGKPVMVGEFGIDAGSWNIAADPHLRGFRQALWGGALGGSVGTAMSWWWENLDADNVYPLFVAMNGILGAAGWQEGDWAPVEFVHSEGPPLELVQPVPNGEPFTTQVALNGFRRHLQRKFPGEVAVASRQAADRASEFLSGFLRGSKEADLQRSVKLTAFFGGNARLLFHVKSVASDAVLAVRVGGKELLRTNFVGAGAAPTRPQVINQDFALNLPPDKQVVEIANDAGADWILLDSLKLEQVLPAEFAGGWTFGPEPVGLRNGKKAVLYVCSPWSVYPANALRYNPPFLSDQSVQLAGWPDGTFRAQWFDPSTGKAAGTTEGTTQGTILTLPLPTFSDDLAAIITPRQ
jgi:hypothetical protein